MLQPVPWLKLVAGAVLFTMGLYVGVRWENGSWDAERVAQEKDWQVKLAAALKESGRRQDVADQASKERDDAKQKLATFIAAHPLGPVLLCSHTQAAPTVSHNSPDQPPSTSTPDALQPEAPRDLGPTLDALMGEADVVNEEYRRCKASYEALSAG